MSDTVKRIVELLFDRVEETDEVREMREEVLNDCQAQYEDLIARGLSADEAVAAVVESLTGMEETLAAFPQKQEAGRVAEKGAPAEEKRAEPSAVYLCSRLKIDAKNADLCVVRGGESGLRVTVDGDVNGSVEVREESGCLRIIQHGAASQVRMTVEKENASAGGKGLFGLVMGILANTLGSITISSGPRIRVEAGNALESAELSTTSGEVEVEDIAAGSLTVSSASGDIEVSLSGETECESLALRTMSGEVKLKGSARRMTISSLSGDVRMTGTAERLSLRSTSGDVNLIGFAPEAELHTTSGDVEAELEGAQEENPQALLRCVSTSGDVTVRLPMGVREADVQMKTVSGDRMMNGVQSWDGARIRLEMNSVSGDVSVYPG